MRLRTRSCSEEAEVQREEMNVRLSRHLERTKYALPLYYTVNYENCSCSNIVSVSFGFHNVFVSCPALRDSRHLLTFLLSMS